MGNFVNVVKDRERALTEKVQRTMKHNHANLAPEGILLGIPQDTETVQKCRVATLSLTGAWAPSANCRVIAKPRIEFLFRIDLNT